MTNLNTFSPYTLKVTIHCAANLPAVNLVGGASDPYVILEIDRQKFITTKKLENLNPVWNESFEFSLFQLPDSFEFLIYDWNETLTDKLMGTVSYQLKKVEFGVEYYEVVPVTNYPTANLQFSFSIETLISVEAYLSEDYTPARPQVSKEFAAISTPSTIQQAFYDGDILQIKQLSWSHFRDLLTDVNHLFPDFQDVSQDSPSRCNRDQYLNKFTRGVKIILSEHKYVTSMPLPRFSITFQTTSQTYSIQVLNKFILWKLICEIRRRYSMIERRRDSILEGRSEFWFNQMYSRYYWPEPEESSFSPQTFQIKYYQHGSFHPCDCTIYEDSFSINLPHELLNFSIQEIESILIGGEFPIPQPYDLRIDIISGQIDPQGFTAAQVRSKVLKEHFQELTYTGKSKGIAGVLETLKKSIVLPNSSTVLEASVLYMDLLGGESFVCTPSVSGTSPRWNTSTLLKIGENILNFKERNPEDPTGIMFHLVAENSLKEPFVLGSKFVKFSDLVGDLPGSVQNTNLDLPGNTKSPVVDQTIDLDQDVAIRIDVLNGIDLPPDRQFVTICSFVKFDGNIKKKYHQSKSEAVTSQSKEWNHTFVLSSADGLYWASYVALLIKESGKKGKESLYGAIYIPKADFYREDPSSGVQISKIYPIVPVKGMLTLTSNANLGFLRVKLQLLISQIFQTTSIPTVDIKTQLRLANEYTTSWLCYSLNDTSSITKNSIASAAEEKFLFFPSFEAIILERQHRIPLGSQLGEAVNISPLHHFQRKRRQASPSNPLMMIEEIEFQIFENQRASALGHFSGENLFRYERRVFTDESGAIISPVSPYENENILPSGYTWCDDSLNGWVVEICVELDLDSLSLLTDHEGWMYGTNFGEIMRKYRQHQSDTSGLFKTVRRRKWKRKCYREIDPNQKLTKVTDEWHEDNDDLSVDDVQDDGDGQEEESIAHDNETAHDLLTLEVFQNQRRVLDWGPSLMPFERKHFSNESGNYNYESKEVITPPKGYIWLDPVWTLDRNYLDTDEDGWCYGITFSDIMTDLKNGVGNLGLGIPPSVRRRKFFRRCVRSDSESARNIDPSKFEQEISDTVSTTDIPQTKSEAYRRDRDQILKLCQERETLNDPIVIPWNQVVRVDVVTMSVLAIVVQVHRYMEDGTGQATYRPVDVEIFIADCPAQQLCLLMKNRIHFDSLRGDVRDLLSSGTMTGQQGNYVDYSSAAPDVSLPELTLGSSTILYLENEIVALRSSISQALKSQNTFELESLELHEARCKLYISTLLGSCLIGPSFSETDIKAMIEIDIHRANELELDSDSSAFEKFKLKNTFLFRLGESRIRDFALCGWAYRGDAFESCLRVLINQYYSVIVQSFKSLCESEIQENGTKLQFLEFFIEYDDFFERISQRALKYYRIGLNPKPILSLCVDIKPWLSNFANSLAQEMLNFVPRIFSANKIEDSDSNLPWEVSKFCLSQIPKDLERLLQVYISMGNFEHISPYFGEAQHLFSSRLRLAYLQSFEIALEHYRFEISRQDWVKTKTAIENDGKTISSNVCENVRWLCSATNDSLEIVHSMYSLECGESCDEFLGDSRQRMMEIMKSIHDIALDNLSCIIFMVSGQILLDPNPYFLWKDDNQFLHHFLNELKDWLHEFFFLIKPNKSRQILLKPEIMRKLLSMILSKINMWYIFMVSKINNANTITKRTILTRDEISHLHSDYSGLISFFRIFSESIDDPNEEAHRVFLESIPSQLTAMFHLIVIVSEDYGNQLMQSINDFSILAQRQTRNDFLILKKFIGLLLQLRGTYRIGSTDEDGDENEDDLADVPAETLHESLLTLFDEPSDGDPQNPFDPSLVTKILSGTCSPDFLLTSLHPVKTTTAPLLPSPITIEAPPTGDHTIHPETPSLTSFLGLSFGPLVSSTIKRNFVNITNVSLSKMMSIPERRDIFIEFSLPKVSVQTPRLTTLNGNWGNEIFLLGVKQELLPTTMLSCALKCVINRKLYLFQSTLQVGSISVSLEELFNNGQQQVHLPINCAPEVMSFLKSGQPPEISFTLSLEVNDL